MRRSKSVALIGGFAAAVAICSQPGEARAADMGHYNYPPQAMPIVQEFTSGWYLRGDLGWRTDAKIGDVTSDFPLPTNNRIGEVATGGVGGGYKAQWFRADVTLDYAGKADYNGDGTLPGAFQGKIESFTALANVYLDLGTWSGFTPYVGVGAGAVITRAFDYVPPAGVVTLDYPTRTDFAWAYMAGVSYAFAPRWLLDFSYRRINLNEFVFNPNLENALHLKDLSANEFRIGVRYTLD